jgi:hypothetical protein
MTQSIPNTKTPDRTPAGSRPAAGQTKFLLQALACAALLACSAIQAHAQGCVAIKQVGGGGSPLGPDDVTAGATDKWDFSLSYEHFRSDKDYTGPYYNGQRQTLGNSVINVVDQFDGSLSYDIDGRDSVSLDIPYFAATRSQLDYAKVRYKVAARGIGDIRVAANRWLVDPAKKPIANLQLGFGVSVPTGTSNAKAWVPTANGLVQQNVDQSIQPGQGGWGYILQGQGYRTLTDTTSLYLTGFYLATPQDVNGTRTTQTVASDKANISVEDQYQLRWGVNQILTHCRGGVLSGSLGGRWEGVPADDLIGRSDGFRRPGYVLSIEPGLAYSLPHDSFSLNVPIAWYRNRTQSYPDTLTGAHGDAFFADFLIIAAYSHKW